MALPTEATGHTYGWSANDFIQNFLAEGTNNRGGADKGANEAKLCLLEGDVVQIGTSFREVKIYNHSAVTSVVVGVALSDAKSGEMVPVSCGPIMKCKCAASITRGNYVGPSNAVSAQIMAITPNASGSNLRGCLGIALTDGLANDVIPVLMKGIGITIVA